MNFRTLCTLIYITFFLIVSFPQRRRLKRLEQTDPAKCSAVSHDQIQKVFRRFLWIAGVKIEVSGLENIPEEACLFVGNHSSYFDILVTEVSIPNGAGFVSKENLKRIPGLSAWMRLIHCLFLDRENIREGLKTILSGVDYLKAGFNMFIFPEGTRTKTGELGEFKGGSLKMAQKADAPVVPVAITGTRAILEANEGCRIKPSHVTVSFGTPFRISELPKEEKRQAAEYTKMVIETMLLKMTS